MATLRWMKSCQKGDLYEPGSPGGTAVCQKRLSEMHKNLLTLLVPVTLNIPVSVDVTGLVLLGASDFNLLETPLRQIDITGAKIAAEVSVTQAERSGQCAQLGVVP